MRALNAPLLSLMVLACGAEQSPPPLAPKVSTSTAPVPEDLSASTVVTPEPLPKVDVTLHMMSQCPYASDTLLSLVPQLDKLGDRVTFRTEYIGQVTEAGELKAMHGPSEITGNIVQLCAQKHAPNWREFVRCQALDPKNIETTFRSCAASAGINPAPVETCASSDEGTRLLAESFERSRVAGARGSPTLHLGGVKFEKSRMPVALLRGVCDAFPASPPQACVDMAPPPEVNVTLLTDARCTTCSDERTRKLVRTRLENPIFTALDYGTADGKALHESIGGAGLPAAVFSDLTRQDPDSVRRFGKTLKQGSDGRYFMAGSHNPVCIDDGGCKVASCKLTPTCRKEEPRVLELFMMSKCPFAAKGVTALAEVLENFEKNQQRVEVRLRFIGSGDAKTGLKAMHGTAEVEENLRQICAFKHYAAKNKFVRYLKCRAADLSSKDWAACTGKDTGVDKAVLEKCSTGDEGKRLLEASYKLSEDSGIASSPTWLASAKHKFAGVDARTINEKFCEHNKLRGCDAVLSGPPPKSTASPPIPPGP